MTKDDRFYLNRVALFAHAERVGVSQASRDFQLHRSTYYRWRRQVLRNGLEILRPRERRLPRMPNQLPPWTEQKIVTLALAQPGLGPRRLAPSWLSRTRLGNSASQPLAYSRCFTGMAWEPGPGASPSSPATPLHQNVSRRDLCRSISKQSSRVTWSRSTASTSGL